MKVVSLVIGFLPSPFLSIHLVPYATPGDLSLIESLLKTLLTFSKIK